MKPDTLLLLGALGIAAYFLTRRPDRKGQIEYIAGEVTRESNPSVPEMQMFIAKLNSMTDDEVGTVYDYFHDFVSRNRDLVEGSDLYNRLVIVSNKYGIFT